MRPDETLVEYKKRVDDYEKERLAHGLTPLSEAEMVVNTMTMLDGNFKEYVNLVFQGERMRGGALPASMPILWRQLRDFQLASSSKLHHHSPATGTLRAAFVVHNGTPTDLGVRDDKSGSMPALVSDSSDSDDEREGIW